ncbi:MAG: flagellar filament capping protein FliD [Lachnospiraceae bacterium]|nr:flagellar filament capping protein FliD [Lachnospiraceae bacterium]
MASLALQNVYNNFLPQFMPKTTRYDTHKKDELRNVYAAIMRQTKESPLFLPLSGDSVIEYAVNMKENARDLKNVIASLSNDDSISLLDKKTAFSTDESVATAKYIGNDNAVDPDAVPSFDLGVQKLAAKQTNLGSFIDDGPMSLEPDTYSFDIHIGDTDYEFQFNVEPGDTNREMEDKLARLINRSNIGVEVSVVSDNAGRSALKIDSVATGKPEGREDIFTVSDDSTSKRAGAVAYFGLGEVASKPQNAEFTLNGNPHSAYSNSFTIDKAYEVTLKGVSEEGEDTHIGLKPDVESLISNVESLVDGYNKFISKAYGYTETYGLSNKFRNEMRGIQNVYRNELDAIGLTFKENGELEIDDKYLRSAALEGDHNDTLRPITDFASEILLEAKKISLNPMNYTNRIVVEYKNPGHNFANPYITSMYSGMMFSSYM